MNILLIAGHGAGDPGATGNGYREADETRKVTAALKTALDGYAAVDTYPTDRNAFSDYQSGTLRTLAQFVKYDFVLEIHFNAFQATRSDGVTMGTEIYVPTTEENTAVAQAIVNAVAGCGLKNRGVKQKNYSVIASAKQSGVSAALLEVCFIDDPDDMAVYSKKFSQIVNAVSMAIVREFNLKKEEETLTGEQIYKALNDYVKTLPVPDWAKAELEEAKAAGITDGSSPMELIPRYQAAIMALRAKK